MKLCDCELLCFACGGAPKPKAQSFMVKKEGERCEGATGGSTLHSRPFILPSGHEPFFQTKSKYTGGSALALALAFCGYFLVWFAKTRTRTSQKVSSIINIYSSQQRN